jgi:hypothetical protein
MGMHRRRGEPGIVFGILVLRPYLGNGVGCIVIGPAKGLVREYQSFDYGCRYTR